MEHLHHCFLMLPSQSIPQPLPPKTCHYILLFLEFSIMESSSVLSGLLSFIQGNLVRFVLVVVVLLALSSIPLVWIHHVFIHSLVDAHLGFFPVWSH